MSTCSHCGDEGHNIRTCPVGDVEKGPWFKDADKRWHTKIVHEDDGALGTREREVACNCDLFDEGEKHYDFDGM